MAKKEELNEKVEPAPVEIKKAEEKIEAKIEVIDEKASKIAGKPVDITSGARAIEDPTDKTEVAAYFKRLDEKLDKLLAGKEKSDDLKLPEIKSDSHQQRRDHFGFEY
jgi:hypothetical protein